MTVTYAHDVGKKGKPGGFLRLLFRWKGSIYKVVLPEVIAFMLVYGGISATYRLWVVKDPVRKVRFEKWTRYCADYDSNIHFSFILGWFVNRIITRRWQMWMTIPYPDPLCLLIANAFRGPVEETRIIKRTISRYFCLSFTITMTMISPGAKRRFPTTQHFVDFGLMYPHEKDIFDQLESKSDYPKYWVPLVWASNVIYRARRKGLIGAIPIMDNCMGFIEKFRESLGQLLAFDWIPLPLVYTQVATLAVYLYFAVSLFGKQFLQLDKKAKSAVEDPELDPYVPIFLLFEFFFYSSWLKVAETMVNPFGEDDDDFEINWIIDRHVKTTLLIVDEVGEDIPSLWKDLWFDKYFPEKLPYTEYCMRKFKTPVTYGGSATMCYIDLDTQQSLFTPSPVRPTKSTTSGNTAATQNIVD